MKEDLKSWGFTIRSFEIKDIKAADKRVRAALNDQINAQQNAKEKQINSDSDLASKKFKSDAEKFTMMLEADGE